MKTSGIKLAISISTTLALLPTAVLAQAIYTPYTFTTLAGLAGNSGSADGTGRAARFYNPTGGALDPAGNVYVTDGGNHTIRRVGAGGVVTTLAGLAGSAGSADGTGSAGRVSSPWGLAADRS